MIYSVNCSAFNKSPLLGHPNANIKELGNSGVSSVGTLEPRSGCLNTTRNCNRCSWSPSPFTAKTETTARDEHHQAPFDLNYAMSAGIIASWQCLHHNSSQITNLPSRECANQSRSGPMRRHHPINAEESLTPPRSQKIPASRAAMLGFIFLLQSSEYLVVRGRKRIYTLQVRDIRIRDRMGRQAKGLCKTEAVEIIFRGQKNDQHRQGPKRVLFRSGHSVLCPVILRMFLVENPRRLNLQQYVPIWSTSPSRMLPAETLSQALQAAAKASGEDATIYSCRSLRRGGARALLAAGVDSTTVMLHGRWKSDSHQRYITYTNESGTYLATRMAFGIKY
ncbi:Hypothetical protein PHPALM_3118 [Phytophthora palmivora]|uniref:Tyr recombinase domain-containing protein n=1 Tax=Phytophthora palmivora TaxID=4796 RepID=A0A2P4YND0_9STRA|nr:Hypothetical protein PHPALM_3118 [Phytophthora palmivora]